MTYRIRWEGDPRPDLEQELRKDIAISLEEEPVASLVSHVWVITSDREGPSVYTYFDTKTDELVARYNETTEWITLKSLDDA